jgi:hypothetical protein
MVLILLSCTWALCGIIKQLRKQALMQSSSTYTFVDAMMQKGLIMMNFVEFVNCLNLLEEKALITTPERQALMELAQHLNLDTSSIDD